MVKRIMAILFGVYGVGLVLFVIWLIFFAGFPPINYPTSSSPRMLDLASNGPRWNRPVITLRHYIYEKHTADYILTIENGVSAFEPQSYELPDLTEGFVEIVIEMNDSHKSAFTIPKIQADELLRYGLLIYWLDIRNPNPVDYAFRFDEYVNFIIGERRITYVLPVEEQAESRLIEWVGGSVGTVFTLLRTPEWVSIENGPDLIEQVIPEIGFGRWYSGWRANEWVRVEADG